MGIVSNKVQGYDFIEDGQFKFAYLADSTRLVLRKEAFPCESRTDIISLQDGTYKISKGVLYVKATRTTWRYMPDYCCRVDVMSARQIFKLYKWFIDNVKNPPVEKEVIIHRWWMWNKKIQAVEFSEGDPLWFQDKKEYPFELAVSNFQLIEVGA
jgi:hypothetical protein